LVQGLLELGRNERALELALGTIEKFKVDVYNKTMSKIYYKAALAC